MNLRDIDWRTWRRLLIVVSALVVFRVALQAMLPPSISSSVQPSALAQAGLTIPAVIVLFLAAYLLMGVTFVLLQDWLLGTKASKGLRFGLAFVLMWGAYLLEPVGLSVGAYSETIKTAVVDTVPIALLGVALGLFLSKSDGPGAGRGGIRVLFLAAIPAAFIAVRLMEYSALGIYSVFPTMPLASMMWAAGTGICLSVMYLLIRNALPARSPLKRACLFGIGVFAANLFVFNLFMPAIMEYTAWGIGALSYADLAVRTMMDTAAVLVGVLVFERLSLTMASREVSDGRSAEG